METAYLYHERETPNVYLTSKILIKEYYFLFIDSDIISTTCCSKTLSTLLEVKNPIKLNTSLPQTSTQTQKYQLQR